MTNQQKTASIMAKYRVIVLFCISLFALIVALFAFPPAAAAEGIFASGTGSSQDPFIINTQEQFKAFRNSVNQGTSYEGEIIVLGADIALDEPSWTPIGTGTRKSSTVSGTSTPFKGVFNGKGHTISGLSITKTQTPNYAIGLFGVLDGAVVENLVLQNVNIDVAASDLAGGLAGLMLDGAEISNVEVSGTVTAGGGVGGICGRLIESGTISGCINNATVRATGSTGNVGGIVGAAYYTRLDAEMHITNCVNNGETSGQEAVGGIVGLSAATVSLCTNTAPVTGSTYSIGGIVGEQRNYGNISECNNSAEITNTSQTGYGTGGIVGWIRYNGAKTAYLANKSVVVFNNNNSGVIKGGTGAGGIAGVIYDSATVTGNENTAPHISDSNFAGGIVGDLQESGDAGLPAVIKLGVIVDNNVSTTPIDAISGADKAQFAYNNNPLVFTVKNNGIAWVAQVGTTRFATLAGATDFAVATIQGTEQAPTVIQLIADAINQPTVSLARPTFIALDLAGHSIQFADNPAFDIEDGTYTITGDGHVLSTDDKIDSLIVVDETQSADHPAAHFVLTGGTYKQDVEPYVGEGYTEVVVPQSADGATYMVTKATPDDSGDKPTTPDKPSTPDTPVVPGTDTPSINPSDKPDKPETPSNPGTDTPATPSTPDNQPGTTPDSPSEEEVGSHGVDAQSANSSSSKAQTTSSTSSHNGKVVQTGDVSAVAIGVCIVLIAGSVIALKASRKKASLHK